MEEGVVRSRFGHFRSFLEVCVVVFVTHVVPFFDKSHFLITVACRKIPKVASISLEGASKCALKNR